MEKQAKLWTILGIVFTLIVGTLLHFVYDWSGQSTIVGIFGAVNESTWEHLKLLFWPMLIFGIVEYFAYGKNMDGFLFAKAIGILAAMATTVVSFYTYVGIVGDHFLLCDIATFVLGVLVGYFVSYKLLLSGKYGGKGDNLIGGVILLAFIIMFVVFSFSPPHIPLFLDPTTELYGMS